MKRPERIGDYRIVEELARGGFGVVYVAEHGTLRRRVALKLMLGDRGQETRDQAVRFWGEGRALARLRHPNVVTVHETGHHKGLGHPPTTARVGSFPNGASPWGCLDMAGNVAEWVEDAYLEDERGEPLGYSGVEPGGLRVDPAPVRGPADARRVTRGGHWDAGAARRLRATWRKPRPADARLEKVGFRVCLTPP